MRKVALLVWLMIPVLAGAFHYGPGQRLLELDDAARLVSAAEAHAKAEQWADAEEKYAAALELLPEDRVEESRRIRLERAKAQMFIKKLPVAHQSLKGLVDELQEESSDKNQALLSDAQRALANSQYYMTWLMRLEGKPEEAWKPEIESARQTFRLLAENAAKRKDGDAEARNRKDLESSIRLARMELTELQGLPLPSQ